MSLKEQYKQTRLYEINGVEFYVKEMTDELATEFGKILEKSIEASNPLMEAQKEAKEEELKEINDKIKAINCAYFSSLINLFAEWKDPKKKITNEIIESEKFEKGKVQFLANFLLMNR